MICSNKRQGLLAGVLALRIFVAPSAYSETPSTFRDCLSVAMEIVESEDSRYFFHECLGFYTKAPFNELRALPPQVFADELAMWIFQEIEGDASITFFVASLNEYSKSALEKHTAGARNGFFESGKSSGREVTATNPVLLWEEEDRSASFEAAIDGIPLVYRTLILPGGTHDEAWVVSISVVGFDLESAHWVTDALSVMPVEDDR